MTRFDSESKERIGRRTFGEHPQRRDHATQTGTMVFAGEFCYEFSAGIHGETVASAGEYLVIVKPDGTVLLHDGTGYRPVAWVVGAEVEMDLNGEVLIRARDTRPRSDADYNAELVIRPVTPVVGFDARTPLQLHKTPSQFRELLAAQTASVTDSVKTLTEGLRRGRASDWTIQSAATETQELLHLLRDVQASL